MRSETDEAAKSARFPAESASERDFTHASREAHAEYISVFCWRLRRHPDMEAVRALVELKFRIAA